MIKLNAQIRVQRLAGKIMRTASDGAGGPLQAKTVYPSHSEQIIVPDEDFYGLSIVTVKATPRLPAFAMSVCEGNGDIFYGDVVENVVNIAVGVESVTAEKYYTYFLYNGVRLPRIPFDVLEKYPHIWISGSDSEGYKLTVSAKPWYYNNERMYLPVSAYNCRYTFKNDAWVKGDSYTDTGAYTAGTLLWTSHDIPNGSADATDIYFKATEPVPTD